MSSAICGGVISQTKFASDPWAYMMCFVMPDDKYKEWQDSNDDKFKKELLNKYARSVI